MQFKTLVALFTSLLAVPTSSAPTDNDVEVLERAVIAPRGTMYFKLCTGKNIVDCYDAPNTNAHCTNIPATMNDRIRSAKATGQYDICYLYLDYDCQGGLRGGPGTWSDDHKDFSAFGAVWDNSVSSYVCV